MDGRHAPPTEHAICVPTPHWHNGEETLGLIEVAETAGEIDGAIPIRFCPREGPATKCAFS